MLHCAIYKPNLKYGPFYQGSNSSTDQLAALYLTAADHDNFICAWQLDTFQWNYYLEMTLQYCYFNLESREPREKQLIKVNGWERQ